MIQVTVDRNGERILERQFTRPDLSLEDALSLTEMYIVNEQLNVAGECNIRAIFPNLTR